MVQRDSKEPVKKALFMRRGLLFQLPSQSAHSVACRADWDYVYALGGVFHP